MRLVVGDGQNFESNFVRGHRNKKERVQATGLMIIIISEMVQSLLEVFSSTM